MFVPAARLIFSSVEWTHKYKLSFYYRHQLDKYAINDGAESKPTRMSHRTAEHTHRETEKLSLWRRTRGVGRGRMAIAWMRRKQIAAKPRVVIEEALLLIMACLRYGASEAVGGIVLVMWWAIGSWIGSFRRRRRRPVVVGWSERVPMRHTAGAASCRQRSAKFVRYLSININWWL